MASGRIGVADAGPAGERSAVVPGQLHVYLPSPIDRELRVTRPEFEALVRNDLLRTVDELGMSVQKAGLKRDELAAIYLTGGSSRIPLVTNLVHEAFAQVPNTWEDPKCVVALGAIRADALRDALVPSQPGIGGRNQPPRHTRLSQINHRPRLPGVEPSLP